MVLVLCLFRLLALRLASLAAGLCRAVWFKCLQFDSKRVFFALIGLPMLLMLNALRWLSRCVNVYATAYMIIF